MKLTAVPLYIISHLHIRGGDLIAIIGQERHTLVASIHAVTPKHGGWLHVHGIYTQKPFSSPFGTNLEDISCVTCWVADKYIITFSW